MKIPKTPKGLSNQITKIRSELSAFKREHDFIHDRSGARYYLFYLYFLLGDNHRSSEYIRWYEKEFSDDANEPTQLLCWALILHRMGKAGDYRLAETMLSNIYLIPHILGGKMAKADMWHSNSDADPEYLEWIPTEIIEAITAEDKSWIEGLYFSEKFQQILNRHIEINHLLQTTPIGERRSALVEEEFSLLDEWR